MPTIYHYTEPVVVSQERYNRLITRSGWFASSTLPTANVDRPAVSPVIDLRDFGTDGSGNHDDTSAVQLALTQASSVGGTVSMFGVHPVQSTLSLPDGVHLTSSYGRAKISVAAGFNFPVIKADGVNARLSNFVIEKASGVNAGSSGYGIYVVGNATDLVASDVTVKGAQCAVYAAGQNGTTPGTVSRLVLFRVVAKSSGIFGFEIDEVDGVELVACASIVSVLDGVKLRRKTKNVTLTGGYFTLAGTIPNAVGVTTKADGLDAFAGGDSFTINGGVYSGNTVNGATVKCDTLTRDDPTTYGYVRNINMSNIVAQNNGGNGVTVHRFSGNPDDNTIPLVGHATITGGIYTGNTNYGVYLLARQVTVQGAHANRNGLDGIYLEPACMDVDIVNCHVAGNSVTTPGARDGFHIDGTRITLRGGSSCGVDPDIVRTAADLAGVTPTQRYGVRIASTATLVDYDGVKCTYNATGDFSDASNVATAMRGRGAVFVTDRYYTFEGARSTLAITKDVEYAAPFWVARPGWIKSLGAEITVGVATAVLRLGVRAHRNMSEPGIVLGQTTVDASAATASGIESAVDIYVPYAGPIFLTCTLQVATGVTVRTASQGNFSSWSGALSTTIGATPLMGYITAATVTSTLTDTYTVSNRAGAVPLVTLKGK